MKTFIWSVCGKLSKNPRFHPGAHKTHLRDLLHHRLVVDFVKKKSLLKGLIADKSTRETG